MHIFYVLSENGIDTNHNSPTIQKQTHLLQSCRQQMIHILPILHIINERTQLHSKPPSRGGRQISKAKIIVTATFEQRLQKAEEFGFREGIFVELGVGGDGGVGCGEGGLDSGGEGGELRFGEAPAEA